MQHPFELLEVFHCFHSLNACSGVSPRQCGYKDLEMDKMLNHIRKCVCAFMMVVFQNLKDESHVDSELLALKLVVNEAINFSKTKEIKPSTKFLILSPFQERTILLPPWHWIMIMADERICNIEWFHKEFSLIATSVPDNALTPAHVIAMVQNPNMKLAKHIFEKNPDWLYMRDERGYLPIHYAARFSNSVELIQCMLKIYPANITKVLEGEGMPLLYLSCRYNTLVICEILLKADPSMLLVYDVHGRSPFHGACIRGDLDVVELLMSHAPDIIKARLNVSSLLPLHCCMGSKNCFELFMRVLEAYPVAISTVAGAYGTPLHTAVGYGRDEIVRYICTRHAKCASIPSSDKRLPLHDAMFSEEASMSVAKLVYEAYPQAISIGGVDRELPIHVLFTSEHTFKNETDLATDKLRFILSKCPDCVSISRCPPFFNQPAYQLSLSKTTFVQRLVLRAKPDMNLQLYHKLNYTARRMGMFLGFAAKTADGSQCFMHRMQIKNFDVFRLIISYF